jgi:hypothetical protein
MGETPGLVRTIPLWRSSHPATQEHPSKSFVATAFNFRPQDDACGLVIDRMWITRGFRAKSCSDHCQPIEYSGHSIHRELTNRSMKHRLHTNDLAF